MKKYKVNMLDGTSIDYEHLTKIQSEVADYIIKNKDKNVVLKFQTQCHVKGTKIPMHDGTLKKIEDINVGDFVLSPSGKRRVKKLHRGIDDMYKITPHKYAEPFIVSEKHAIHVKRYISKMVKRKNINTQTFCDVTAEEIHLMNKTNLHKTKLVFGGYELEEKKLPIPPYILGIWLGDGTSSLKTLSITNEDECVISKWKEYAEKNDNHFKFKEYKGKCTTYYITSKDKVSPAIPFRDLNLDKNKHIPAIYFSASKRQRLELLAGLIDTDGSVSNNTIDYICKQKQLAKDILRLVRSVGGQGTLKESWKKCQGWNEKKKYYRLTISSLNISGITNVPHKKIIPYKRKQSVDIVGIKKVEKIGKGEYFGIEIDGDHLYYDEQFIIHHNTGKTKTATKAIKGYNSPLIICPAKLSPQWLEELREQNISSCDIISINKLNMGDNAKSYNWKRHDIIVIDEFQEMLKSKTMKQLQKMKSLHLLGLSATPAGNDNLNYFKVAKTFFHKEQFVKDLTQQEFVDEFLEIDKEELRKHQIKRVKTWLPPTKKDVWKKDFETNLNGLIELKRDIKQAKVEVVDIDFYSNLKNKVFTRFDGTKFFATSTTQSAKLRRLQQICSYKWNGSFETFEVHGFTDEFKKELDEMKSDKTLIVTRTPQLAEAIADYLDIVAITGAVDSKDRKNVFENDLVIATLQTVGVGVSSLHHLEKIVLIEPADGQATIEQLKGRIINNAKSDLKLEIWR